MNAAGNSAWEKLNEDLLNDVAAKLEEKEFLEAKVVPTYSHRIATKVSGFWKRSSNAFLLYR